MAISFQFYKETEFKEVELNGRIIEIPEDWEVVELDNRRITKLIKAGSTPSKKKLEYWNGDIPFVTIGDMTKTSKYLIDTQEKITELALRETNTFLAPENCVLLSMYGTIGKAVIPKVKVAISQNIASIIPNWEDLNEEYLYYSIQQYSFQFYMAKVITLKHLDLKMVKKFKIPLPPLEEQKKIAHVLRTIDNAIEIVDKAIEKLERIKKATMEQLLTKGIVLGFMFDTNIFDKILDGEIELPQNLNYYATHIQYDEICKIPDRKRERREELLKVFNKVPKEVILTGGFVVGVSRLDMVKLGSDADGELYNRMLKRLKELDEKSGKQKRLENQARDVLIALTSIKNRLVLVTEDRNLKKVVEEFGGCAITFEQFIRGKYREFRDTEIGKIPKDWEVVRIKETGKVVTGKTPSTNKKEYWDGDIPFITPADITDSLYVSKTKRYVKREWAEQMGLLLPPETVLVVCIGSTIGKVALTIKESITNQQINALVPFKGVDSHYLYYILAFHSGQLKSWSGTAAVPIIKKSLFEKFKIPLPPLEEQKQIAKILKTIDEAIELKKKKKEKLERMKKAVMNKLLTGQIRIK